MAIEKSQKNKTKKELIEELNLLRKRLANLERVDIEKRERMRRLAVVVQDSNDAITIQDFSGRILAWNRGAERIYGYSEKEALQMNISQLTPPGKEAEQEEFVKRIMAGGIIDSFETQRMAKDGHVLDIWLTVTRLVDDDKKPVAIASTERDITERKRLSEQKDNFMNMVSHELRTPLSSIKESISLMLEGLTGTINEKQREALCLGKRNIDRLTKLINQVLDFQKISSGQMKFDFENNDLNSIIKEAHMLMISFASKKGLKLTLDLDAGLPRIQVDKDRITEVLHNLINNAIKYTEEGMITITTNR